MKTPDPIKYLTAVSVVAALWQPAAVRAGDINGTNLTIQQVALFGTVYADAAATTTAEGLRIDTSQATAVVYSTSVTPGYYLDSTVSIEDWGWVWDDNGSWVNTTEWQVVGTDTIPATHDVNGNEITPETSVARYDWVITGTTWVPNGWVWGVTGTHTENQQVWVPEQTNTLATTTNGGAPRVRFNATRSDANFAFRVPSPSAPDGMKDILVVWEGGLTLPNNDPTRTSVFTAGALQQSWNRTWSDYVQQTTSAVRAEVTTQTSAVQRIENGAWLYETSVNEARPESIRLALTETSNGTSAVAQTLISAKSATFAGLVQVAGDVKVNGSMLIQPSGDLTMGIYTNGPQP